MTIKQVVNDVLREYPETRNNDFLLCIHTYIRMGFAHKGQTKIIIDFKNIESAPSFETITRFRREIQNNEKRYQATQEIQKRRRDQEQAFYMRYSKLNTFPNSLYSK